MSIRVSMRLPLPADIGKKLVEPSLRNSLLSFVELETPSAFLIG